MFFNFWPGNGDYVIEASTRLELWPLSPSGFGAAAFRRGKLRWLRIVIGHGLRQIFGLRGIKLERNVGGGAH